MSTATSTADPGGLMSSVTYSRAQLVVDRVLKVVSVIFLLALATTQLIPLYWMASSSFKLPDGLISIPPQWFPDPISFHAWGRLARNASVARWVGNTVFITLVTTVVGLVFNTMAGYTFAKMRFPGRWIMFWLVIATMTIPGQVVLIPQYTMLAVELKWLNTYRALILPSLGSAFFIFLMRQFLDTLPSTLTDAGRMDACSEPGILFKIVIPLAVPALAVFSIFSLIGGWNNFFWPLLMSRDPTMYTLQLGLANLRFGYGGQDYGFLMAGATFSAVPVIIVFLSLQRYFLTGLTLGAIKG